MRIESDHFDFLLERGAGGAHDFVQDARVEKKCRAEIEAETLGLNRGSATADDGQAFDDADAQTSSSKEDRRRQTARACAHDYDGTLLRSCC